MKRIKNTVNAFSLLEKALRSGLNSPLNRWFNKARNPRIPSFAFAHSSAFSLAEAMVVLVIIAIVMAMAAPLIAHKANTDQKRLIFNGVSPHIATAMGNSQNFGIGTNNPSDAKLTVNAKTQNLVANFISNYTPSDDTKAKKPIFQVKPASGDKLINENGFQVFADGTTNAGCMPDYTSTPIYSESIGSTNIITNTSDTDDVLVEKNTYCTKASESKNLQSRKWTIKKDGYFMISRCVYIMYNPGSTTTGIPICPPVDISYIKTVNPLQSDGTRIPKSYIERVYLGYQIIPVIKGMVITDGLRHFPDVAADYDNTDTNCKDTKNYNFPVDGYNVARFIPCKK